MLPTGMDSVPRSRPTSQVLLTRIQRLPFTTGLINTATVTVSLNRGTENRAMLSRLSLRTNTSLNTAMEVVVMEEVVMELVLAAMAAVLAEAMAAAMVEARTADMVEAMAAAMVVVKALDTAMAEKAMDMKAGEDNTSMFQVSFQSQSRVGRANSRVRTSPNQRHLESIPISGDISIFRVDFCLDEVNVV